LILCAFPAIVALLHDLRLELLALDLEALEGSLQELGHHLELLLGEAQPVDDTADHERHGRRDDLEHPLVMALVLDDERRLLRPSLLGQPLEDGDRVLRVDVALRRPAGEQLLQSDLQLVVLAGEVLQEPDVRLLGVGERPAGVALLDGEVALRLPLADLLRLQRERATDLLVAHADHRQLVDLVLVRRALRHEAARALDALRLWRKVAVRTPKQLHPAALRNGNCVVGVLEGPAHLYPACPRARRVSAAGAWR